MSKYLPKQYKPFGGNVKVEVGFSNYTTKATRVGTSNLATNVNLPSVKADIEKIDLDKLKRLPVDLSKLSNLVNNEHNKKNFYNKLVATVKVIDTSVFVLKTKYDTDKSDLEKKICDASALVKKQAIMLNLLK